MSSFIGARSLPKPESPLEFSPGTTFPEVARALLSMRGLKLERVDTYMRTNDMALTAGNPATGREHTWIVSESILMRNKVDLATLARALVDKFEALLYP